MAKLNGNCKREDFFWLYKKVLNEGFCIDVDVEPNFLNFTNIWFDGVIRSNVMSFIDDKKQAHTITLSRYVEIRVDAIIIFDADSNALVLHQ